jgi:CSLREA domain-containing protein
VYEDRVRKFNSNGEFLTQWTPLSSGYTADVWADAWEDIAVDTEGTVYVLGNYGYILKYTSDGTFISEWDIGGYDQYGVATDAEGNVFVTDAGRSPFIRKFTSDGELITEWGTYGTDDGQFIGPLDIAVDESGNIYVVDRGNSRIQKFTLKEVDETTLIVNTTGDKSDADPNDGVADVDLKEEGNQCTLRAAIEEANRRSDEDSTITFDIPTDDSGYNSSTGIATISPKKPLPAIKRAVTIDATSQPDGTIELNGKNAGEEADGLRITAGDCSIKGLVIKGFEGNGITVKDEGDIYLSDVEIVENCGWGIRATGSINIGVEDGITVSQESKIGNNGNKSGCKGGGIRSSNGGVSASYLEVTDNGGPGILATKDIDLYGAQVNNNKGPGIQSFEGIITFHAISDFSNRVTGNKGYGIFSGRAQDPDDPKPYGVKIGTSIEVKDNALYGIYAKGSIYINDAGGLAASSETSVVSNNGNGTECWVVETKNQEPTRSKRCKHRGGIRSIDNSIFSYGKIEVTNNGGAGILADEEISLEGAQVKNNKGPGIQSFLGIITVAGTTDFSCQITSNKGYGIFSGRAQDPDDPKPYGVKTGTSIEVTDNALCGIYAKGSIYINDAGGLAASSETSVVGNNGNSTECWVVETKNQEPTRSKRCKYRGGIWSILNSVVVYGRIEVTDNGGIGIKTGGDLTIDEGEICNNEGGDVQVGGKSDLSSNVTICDTD